MQPLFANTFAERDAGGSEASIRNGQEEAIWSGAGTQNHLLEGEVRTLRRFGDSFPSTSVSALTQLSTSWQIRQTQADGYARSPPQLLKRNKIAPPEFAMTVKQTFRRIPFSPQASVAVQVARATEVQFGYRRYIQYRFPPFPGTWAACQLNNYRRLRITSPLQLKNVWRKHPIARGSTDRQSSDIFTWIPLPVREWFCDRPALKLSCMIIHVVFNSSPNEEALTASPGASDIRWLTRQRASSTPTLKPRHFPLALTSSTFEIA